MADISIQFHAHPDELEQFVSEWARKYRLNLVGVELKPFRVFRVGDTRLDLASNLSIQRIAFFASNPDLSVNTPNEFSDQNPDKLLLAIGRLEERGLRESWLTAKEDSQNFPIWKKIAKELKTVTQAGAVAVNPATGAKSKLRTHRYTKGAKALEQEGMDILPVAGSAKLKLG
jgi:hypothetical protein